MTRSHTENLLPTARSMEKSADLQNHDQDKATKGKIEQATETVNKVIEKTSEAVPGSIERIASGAQVAVEKIVKAAAQATTILGAKSEQLSDIQDRLVEDCRLYVRAKPVTALGVAVVAGFILARLFNCK